MNKLYRSCVGIAAATTAAFMVMSPSAAAAGSAQWAANAPILYAGPDGANIRDTPYASGDLVDHVPSGTPFSNIECRLTNNEGNAWYRLNNLPDPTYVYSGNLTSAPGIPSC